MAITSTSFATPIPFVVDFNAFLFENDFLALFPDLFLLLATLLLVTAGVQITTSRSVIWVTTSSYLGLYILFLTYVLLEAQPIPVTTQVTFVFFNSLVLDPISLFYKRLLLVSLAFTICIALQYNKKERINQFEIIILLLLSGSSMIFLLQSADLITMYLAIELQSLSFYVMAALKPGSPFSSEAGCKYFLLGAFSSGILLWGCSLIYGFTGVTEFSQLSKICNAGDPLTLSPLSGCELGIIFLVVALLFKLTAVPFHVWAPDVYEGAPTSVTAYFSLAPKVAILAVMIRFFGCTHLFGWWHILILSSGASLVLGSFAALGQYKIKRLLAFSSISHVGYMLLACACNSLLGIQGLTTYVCIYVVMTVNLFGVFLLSLGRQDLSETLHSVSRVKYITDLTQLALTNPALAACLTVTLFSMAGIPPLAGFYAKAGVFLAALSHSQYLLAVLGVVTSVISCYYYIRLVKVMYFEKSNKWLSFSRVEKASSLSLSLSFFFLITFILYPAPLYLASHLVSCNLFF